MFSPYKLVLLVVFFVSNGVYAEDSSPYYVELFGGQGSSVSGPDEGPDTVGGNFNGRMRDVNLDVGKIYGIRAGYIMSDNYRFDISYYKTKSDLDWLADFSSTLDVSDFVADMDSQIVLVSAYYNFNTGNSFSPYVGVGVGLSRNEFKSAAESILGTGLHVSYPASNTKTQFAYRLAVGADYLFTKNLSFNADFSLINIGDASSGNTRLDSTSPPIVTSTPIGAYKFEDIWIRALTVGLKYRF